MYQTNTGSGDGKRIPGRVLGFTLIEVMVVMVILGILAAIGYPGYRQYVVRSQRGMAKATMVQVFDRQEQFFIDNKAYATDVTNLGFPANPFSINRGGKFVATSATDRIYTIQLDGASATAFTIQAVPQLKQATEDSACGTLSVTNEGVKSASGSGTNCW